MYSDLITIAIPVYNRTDFFKEAVESALAQTVQVRVLVVDNASSTDYFERYVLAYNNPLLTYHRNSENVGMFENWNVCLKIVQSPWITILHDDDTLFENFVEYMLYALNNLNNPIALAGQTEIGELSIKQNQSKKRKEELHFKKVEKRLFLDDNISPFPGILLDRENAIAVGGFDISNQIADFDLWYRLFKVGNIYLLDEYLAFYRMSPQQASTHLAQGIINTAYNYKIGIASDRHERNIVRSGIERHKEFYERLYSIQLAMPFKQTIGKKFKLGVKAFLTHFKLFNLVKSITKAH